MDLQIVLSYGVTVLGFLLCLFAVVFMLLGRKMPGEAGTPQVIKFKALEVQTNSVLMLFIVSVVVAALPLVLTHYRPVQPTVATPVVTPTTQTHPVFITGYVLDETSRPLEGTAVSLSKIGPDGRSISISDQVVESDGSFSFTQPLGQEERIKVTTKKPGYANQTLILGINSVNYPAVLVKRR